MEALATGTEVDPAMHVQVLTNKLVTATLRDAQMEAVIQTLINKNRELEQSVITLDKQIALYEEDAADAESK